MGRGRAKAKQTKVARDLKYNTPNTDLSALQAELSGSSVVPSGDDDSYAENDELLDDPYAKYYDDEYEDGDEEVADDSDAESESSN